MKSPILLASVLAFSAICQPVVIAQETKNSKESKPKGTLTLLGTIKGEVDKVSDGGHKIEVKYKEMVTAPSRSSTSTRTSSSAKFRPPLPKDLTLKEKNQEIEVRLLDNAVIRILDAAESAPPAKGIDKKKKSDKASDKDKKDDKSDAGDDDDKTKSKQTDSGSEKSQEKNGSKAPKKATESSLPGKVGDPGSLVKGQVIIVTVLREDLPGFSRFVTSTIYILGEK